MNYFEQLAFWVTFKILFGTGKNGLMPPDGTVRVGVGVYDGMPTLISIENMFSQRSANFRLPHNTSQVYPHGINTYKFIAGFSNLQQILASLDQFATLSWHNR